MSIPQSVCLGVVETHLILLNACPAVPERVVLLIPRTPWPETAALSPDSTDTFPSPTCSLIDFPVTASPRLPRWYRQGVTTGMASASLSNLPHEFPVRQPTQIAKAAVAATDQGLQTRRLEPDVVAGQVVWIIEPDVHPGGPVRASAGGDEVGKKVHAKVPS